MKKSLTMSEASFIDLQAYLLAALPLSGKRSQFRMLRPASLSAALLIKSVCRERPPWRCGEPGIVARRPPDGLPTANSAGAQRLLPADANSPRARRNQSP